MRIMVFDVPAERGGALSILNQFYYESKNDKNNDYVFVISKPELVDDSNVKVLRFPWIKKSWMHRWYFDRVLAPKLIKKFKADRVLSLQNVIIPNTKVHQTVYIHNALPFAQRKFSIRESALLWFYQNILGKIIFSSIKKADRVIVQTEWMKKECLKTLKVSKDKIDVIQPKISFQVINPYKYTRKKITTFFYPSNGALFKNHSVLVDACIELGKLGINDYEIILTLYGNENKNILNLYNKVKKYDLPIIFIGNISRKEVFKYYSKSILLFPSYIETVGLPLLEAKMHGSPIIVSDSAFSHEILEGYDKVMYFDPNNIYELTEKMQGWVK